MRFARWAGVVCAFLLAAHPALANGYLEDQPWQFQTTADQANLAAVLGLIQEKKAGAFGPASTTNNLTNLTTIDHQTNCTLAASSYGNFGTNAEAGLAPSSVGPTLSALGNSNGSSVVQQGPTMAPLNLSTGQSNTGAVETAFTGNLTSVSASGPVNQALTSTQTNSGRQAASVANSTACSGLVN